MHKSVLESDDNLVRIMLKSLEQRSILLRELKAKLAEAEKQAELGQEEGLTADDMLPLLRRFYWRKRYQDWAEKTEDSLFRDAKTSKSLLNGQTSNSSKRFQTQAYIDPLNPLAGWYMYSRNRRQFHGYPLSIPGDFVSRLAARTIFSKPSVRSL